MANWNDLSSKLKTLIIKEMNLTTRKNLKLCSSSDKTLVESLKKEVEFVVWNSMMGMNSVEIDGIDYMAVRKNPTTIGIAKCKDSENMFMPNFLGKFEVPGVCAKKALVDVLKSILGPNHLVDVFHVRSDDDKILTNIAPFIKANRTFFGENDGDLIKTVPMWLSMCLPTVEHVHITDVDHGCLEGLGTLEVCKTASAFICMVKTDINDEQLLEFEGKNMELVHSKITSNGVNRLIKKYLANDYPIGRMCCIRMNFDWNVISADLEMVEMEDHVIRQEARLRINNDKELLINRSYRSILLKVVETGGEFAWTIAEYGQPLF